MDIALSSFISARREVQRSLQKNLFRGLALSVAVHFVLVGGYYLHQVLSPEEEIPVMQVRLLKYSELGPPPSIANQSALPSVGITAAARPTIGVPVPVPDFEISAEQTIATQQELSQVQPTNLNLPTSGDAGNLSIQQDITMEEEPSPEAFIAVEKPPVPIKQVRPEYPDIARRAGVEGTVWLKILVDKQGKAKKVIIIKSDAEIFNEPAIAAAMQWVFTPAIMNSGPITVWVAVPFRFRLNVPVL
jgi:periplasmic protein TonB